jgi:hypothetical protein
MEECANNQIIQYSQCWGRSGMSHFSLRNESWTPIEIFTD